MRVSADPIGTFAGGLLTEMSIHNRQSKIHNPNDKFRK
jgi:hypothetical protein